ncbi:MAG: GNAT family N-acetyltransferase [Candidatus Paceibacterota bacterium]
MRIIIKKSKVSDSNEIRLLETKIWGEEVTNKYDMPMIIRFGYVFVACDGKKIIGSISSYRTNKNEVYVCDIVVDEEYRGNRIGERLYNRLLNEVYGTNVVSFLDPDRTATLELHKKLGAKVIKKMNNVYSLDGEDSNLEQGKRLFVRIENK